MVGSGNYCAVYDCLNKSRTDRHLRFFRFPQEAKRCNVWITATGRTDLVAIKPEVLCRSYRICSLHFENNSMLKKKLRKDAIPTLFLPNSEKINQKISPEVEKQSNFGEYSHIFPQEKSCKVQTSTEKLKKEIKRRKLLAKANPVNIPDQPSTSKGIETALPISAAPSILSVQETALPIENASAMETCNTALDIKDEPLQKWEEYESSSEGSGADALGTRREQSQITDNPITTTIKQEPKNVLIGVTGSVATIKLPLLIEKITQICGHTVSIKVVSTEKAFHFFNASELPVRVYQDSEEWSSWSQSGDPVLHINLTKWADLFLVAPLDANTLGKISQGLCDNLLTCVARAWSHKKPLVFCPAMNTQMWEHPVTDEHISRLKRWGYLEVPCVIKTLMCGDTGLGAMAEVDTIASVVKKILSESAFKEIEMPLEIATALDPLAS